MNKLTIFSGNANRPFAEQICEHLNMHLGNADVSQFSNENIFVKIQENIRGHDVFIVQPLSSPVNTSIMELLIMIDTCMRASAQRITAVIPYYAYGRSDKKDQPRVPITARLLADCIQVAKASRVLTMDFHAGQIQGFFNIPVDELTASYYLTRYWKEKNIPNLTVVSNDAGFAKKARNFAANLNVPLAIAEKRRHGNTENATAMQIIGTVRNRNILVVDDEIDTAGSMTSVIKLLKKRGAKDIYAMASHAILSGPAVQRLKDAEIKEIVITDSVPVPSEKMLPNMQIVSLTKLFADAIQCIHEERSISELFKLPQ